MEEHDKEQELAKEFRRYKLKRMIAGILISMVILCVFGALMMIYGKPPQVKPVRPAAKEPAPVQAPQAQSPEIKTEKLLAQAKSTQIEAPASPIKPVAKPKPTPVRAPRAKSEAGSGGHKPISSIPGVNVVNAAIFPMSYELHERFYGWRPNDIFDFTDNVNNFQLGVLEVTRRTTMVLAERLSRTGSTDAFDPNLEKAMNWFMIRAEQYWFPSAEGRYNDGLEEMEKYVRRLEKGQAKFFTRPDNLIPLLAAYEDLLGSCDENLVKEKESDGSKVSTFSADDYYYYAKGVASAMCNILEAVAVDFKPALETRHGMDSLERAIHSLNRSKNMNTWMVTEGDLSGFIANHRANLAAPISHARFYLTVLITTLST